jgi:predicted MFS family arabinose efflux permease
MSPQQDGARHEPAARSVTDVVLHSPRAVKILIIGVFLNRLGSFFSTFLVLLLRQERFSPDEFPLILLAAGAATPIGSLLGGWAADRFSRKGAMVTATLLASAALAVIGESTSRPMVLAGVFAAALFAQAYTPASSALLVDYSSPQDRVPTFAFFRLALNVGAALGPLIAVLVAPHGLHLLFFIDAGTYLLFGVWLAIGLPSPRGRAIGTQVDGSDVSPCAVRRGSRTMRLTVIYICVFLITAVYYQYSSSVALAVTNHHTTSAYAGLLTLNGVLVILFELPLTTITRRYKWYGPMAIGIVLMALGIAISGAFQQYAFIAGGVLIWTAGEMFFSPVANAAIASFSAADQVGRYQGYLSMSQTIAFAIGPALGILVYDIDPFLLWTGCLVAGAVACTGIVLVGRASADEQAPPRANPQSAHRPSIQSRDS